MARLPPGSKNKQPQSLGKGSRKIGGTVSSASTSASINGGKKVPRISNGGKQPRTQFASSGSIMKPCRQALSVEKTRLANKYMETSNQISFLISSLDIFFRSHYDDAFYKHIPDNEKAEFLNLVYKTFASSRFRLPNDLIINFSEFYNNSPVVNHSILPTFVSNKQCQIQFVNFLGRLSEFLKTYWPKSRDLFPLVFTSVDGIDNLADMICSELVAYRKQCFIQQQKSANVYDECYSSSPSSSCSSSSSSSCSSDESSSESEPEDNVQPKPPLTKKKATVSEAPPTVIPQSPDMPENVASPSVLEAFRNVEQFSNFIQQQQHQPQNVLLSDDDDDDNLENIDISEQDLELPISEEDSFQLKKKLF